MIRTLTITYDESNEDIPVMCVAESNIFSITIIKTFTGEKAKQLYKELTRRTPAKQGLAYADQETMMPAT
jgi:hypothetical protein